MTEADLAWAAGIFDGEGSVSVMEKCTEGRPDTWVVQLTVANNHRETVDRFCALVGVGKVYARAERPPARVSYHWMASARAADTALALLRPHVFTKVKQVELAIEARALRQTAAFVPLADESVDRLRQIRDAVRALNGGTR